MKKINATEKYEQAMEPTSDQHFLDTHLERNKHLYESQFQTKMKRNDSLYQFSKTFSKNHAVYDRERDEELKKSAIESMMKTDHVRDELPTIQKMRLNKT